MIYLHSEADIPAIVDQVGTGKPFMIVSDRSVHEKALIRDLQMRYKYDVTITRVKYHIIEVIVNAAY